MSFSKCWKHIRFLGIFLFITFFPINSFGQINAKRVLAMGRSALFYEDYIVGIQYFTMCINAKPYLGEPYYYRSLAKFYLKDYTGAEKDATVAYSKNPFIDNILPLRAICRVKLKNFRDAEEDYKKILTNHPEDLKSWHNLVLCQIGQSSFQRADFTLAYMANINSDSVELVRLSNLVKNSKAGQQAAILDSIFNDTPLLNDSTSKSPILFAQPLYALSYYPSVSMQPTYEAYYAPIDSLNGKCFVKRHLILTNNEGYIPENSMQYTEYETDSLSRCMEGEDAISSQFELYLLRGVDYYHVLNFEAAESDFSKCIQLDSTNFIGYFLRSQARNAILNSTSLVEVKDSISTSDMILYKRNIDDLKKVVDLKPDFAYAYYNLGTVFYYLHDYDSAYSYLSKCIDLDNQNPCAYFNRGLTHLARSNKTDALRDFSDAAQSGFYSAYSVIAFLNRK